MHLAVLILHVIGAGVVLGVVVVSVVIGLWPNIPAERLALLKIIRRIGTTAVGWQIATGLLLAVQDGRDILDNNVFWTKMGLFAVDGVVSGSLVKAKIDDLLGRGTANAPLRGSARLLLLTSVVTVLFVITFGVLLSAGD